jgi:hypothetical protein
MGIALITNNILSDSGTALTSVITGAGTINYLPKFTGASAIGNSAITDDGTNITLLSRGLVGSTIALTTSTLTDALLVNNGSGRGIRVNNSGAGYGLIINNETASSAIPFVIQKSGLDKITFTDAGAGSFASSLTASSFVKSGGTSSQFLKADGSVDSSTYLTTSSASSTYLAKTGGTLTGSLNGTSAVFSGAVWGQTGYFSNTTADNALAIFQSNASYHAVTITNSGSGGSALYISGGSTFAGTVNITGVLTAQAGLANGSGQSFTLPSTTGTLALTSQLSSYLPLSGGTLTGALSGTSATFSSTLSSTGNLTVGNAVAGTNVKIILNGVASKAAGFEFHQSGTPQWYLGNGIASEDNNFELYNSNGTMAMKIIKSTNAINFQGAATFSSSINVATLSINTTTYNGAFAVIKGNNSVPATSGTTTTATLRLTSGTGLYNVLDFGTNESSDYAWIQSTRANSLGTYDKLLLNPNGGNVGIGTTAPTHLLHAVGTSNWIKASYSSSSDTRATEMTYVGIKTTASTSQSNSMQITMEGGYTADGNGSIIFNTGSPTATERMRITSVGSVLIGTTTDLGVNLTIGGSGATMRILPATDNVGYVGESLKRWVAIYAVNGSIQTSDRNEKTNILSSDLGLNYIMKLNPVSYSWKKDDGKKHYGLIAQEIEELGIKFGGLDIENGRYGLSYSEFIAPLIKAVQELKAELDTLKNK